MLLPPTPPPYRDDDASWHRSAPARLPHLAAATWDVAAMSDLVARLHATVAAYVGERRDAGVAIERVLPEVRALVRDAEVAEEWPDELGVLMAQVVRWTLEAYFDEPTLRHVPRFY